MNNSSDAPATPLERLRMLREVIAAEAAALTRVAGELGPAAVQAAEQVAGCRGCVVVTGVGKAGLVGQKLVATLGSTGNRAHFLHPSEAIHGDLGRVGPEDLVWAISNSGRSEELLRIAPHLRAHSRGLIVMTAQEQNPLAEFADVVIAVGEHAEADPLGLAPTTSTTVMLAVGDAIALLASSLVGFRATDFARFHPGGSLGQQLAPVNRLMRPLAQCRTALLSATVCEAMIAGGQQSRRTGAVMLLDDQGRVAGLFTDSDLARLLQQRRDHALDEPIHTVMTSGFTRVQSGMLLADAIEILKHRQISELPVVDRAGRPLGLLDITDVIAVAHVPHDRREQKTTESAATLPISPDAAAAAWRRSA